jgi:hypothetical protein
MNSQSENFRAFPPSECRKEASAFHSATFMVALITSTDGSVTDVCSETAEKICYHAFEERGRHKFLICVNWGSVCRSLKLVLNIGMGFKTQNYT